MIKLEKVKNSRIIFDANILMCGAERSEAEYSFKCMRECYLVGEERKEYISEFIGRNLTIVSEAELYNHDPIYNSMLNSIAKYYLIEECHKQNPLSRL